MKTDTQPKTCLMQKAHLVRVAVMYSASLALLISSLIYINLAAVRAEAFAPNDVVIVMPVRHDAAFLFDANRVADWSSAYDGLVLQERIGTQMLQSQSGFSFTQVSSVTWDFFQVMHIPVVYGNLPVSSDAQTVVLCEDTAFSLFGATDVVGFNVQLSGKDYRISGIVEASAISNSAETMSGFAWVGQDAVEAAGVLYIVPATYNMLSARTDVEELLNYLGHHPRNFILTDSNGYVGSIVLRGQLLLLLCLPIFLFAVVSWLIRLFRLATSRVFYIVATTLSIAAVLVTVLFLWYISTIDLWVPAYLGDGFSGYSRLFFNIGLLAPSAYLPPPLITLYEMNINANIAFGVGVFAIVLIVITKFLFPRPGFAYRDT